MYSIQLNKHISDTQSCFSPCFHLQKLFYLRNNVINYTNFTVLCCSHSAGTGEWAIIELQGDLEVRSNQSMNDQFIGDLYYNKYGQPILIIGHHILQGREQKLDKPFAVLEKSKTNEGQQLLNVTNATLDASALNTTTGIERTLLDDTVALEHKSRQRTEYTVRAVCTKKLIFKSRPKPIIANVAKNV